MENKDRKVSLPIKTRGRIQQSLRRLRNRHYQKEEKPMQLHHQLSWQTSELVRSRQLDQHGWQIVCRKYRNSWKFPDGRHKIYFRKKGQNYKVAPWAHAGT
jgi:hypothetical protein